MLARPDTGHAEVQISRHLEPDISERLGNVLGALAEPDRFPRMTSHPEVVAQMDRKLPESPSIVERPRQALGFAETGEDPLEFSERKECSAQVKAKINGLLQPLAGLRLTPEGRQRLLEARHRLPVGGTPYCLGAGLTEVEDRLLPYLTSHGVVRQPLDVLGQPVRIAAFDGADDAGVQRLPPLLEQGAVGDLMGQRMLEGVLGIRKEPGL